MNIIEITNAYDSAEEAYADWSVLDDAEVVKVAERAARKLARDYEDTGTIELPDALQEALILLATNGRMVRDCLADPGLGYGVLHTRLHQMLVKVVRTDAKHRSGQLSYEAVVDSYASESV
ncbi:hypothetical protein [Streptomyces sp. NPDC056796]|uniref:hypothetical protein n=1 Tax=Streptomyces sp. NPDC056796 TaxID=3345947 RepID=UPI0036A8FBE2